MMSMSENQGEWIPLMDYAVKKGVSLSTLRRHIKARKLVFRVEHGKYLLLVERGGEAAQAGPSRESLNRGAGATFRDTGAPPQPASSNNHELRAKLAKLEGDLTKAQEEIAELKTLIALYEEQMSPQKSDR